MAFNTYLKEWLPKYVQRLINDKGTNLIFGIGDYLGPKQCFVLETRCRQLDMWHHLYIKNLFSPYLRDYLS